MAVFFLCYHSIVPYTSKVPSVLLLFAIFDSLFYLIGSYIGRSKFDFSRCFGGSFCNSSFYVAALLLQSMNRRLLNVLTSLLSIVLLIFFRSLSYRIGCVMRLTVSLNSKLNKKENHAAVLLKKDTVRWAIHDNIVQLYKSFAQFEFLICHFIGHMPFFQSTAVFFISTMRTVLEIINIV